jgi:hypothetical protein
MLSWFKKKTKMERLKKRYACLMRKSYETALRDERKSDKIHRRADKIFEEIKYLKLQNGDA